MLEFLIPIAVFLGFFVGALLARISPEEVGPGDWYFVWLLRMISVAIITAIFYYGGFGVYGFLLGIMFGTVVREYYLSFGLALAMAFLISDSALFLIGALAFAFGIVYGTLTMAAGKFTFTNIFAKIAFFFLPFLILFLGVPTDQFMSFSAGSFMTILTIKTWQKYYKH